MPNPIDIAGQTFGKLSAISVVHRNGGREWLCACACGGQSFARASDLRRSHILSCGCGQRVAAGRVGAANTRHGKRSTPEYRAWASMIYRCENPAHPRFGYWGGRGISVCASWRSSFSAFWADMGERPSPQHSLDRINNDGNYEPGNCRWATKREQVLNRRKPDLQEAA